MNINENTPTPGWKGRWLRALKGEPPRPENPKSSALAPTESGGAAVVLPEFSPEERQILLKLARASVARATEGLPPEQPEAVSPRLTVNRGCFVTLTRHGELRGCVGNVLARQPLYLAVIENARAAATRDPRFAPVARPEVDELTIEISVLDAPRRLSFTSPEQLLEQLEPGVSGVLLEIEGRLSTFLPQVWEQVPDRTEFMNRLAQKAGFPPEEWTKAAISVYRAECFAEQR